ncbi:MAG: hypothetical protein AAGU32_11115 [Bacillota bacterium]
MREQIEQFLSQKKLLFILNYNVIILRKTGNQFSSDIIDLCEKTIKKPGKRITRLYPNEIDITPFNYLYTYEIAKTPAYKTLILSDDGINSIVGFSKKINDSYVAVVPFDVSQEANYSFIDELLNIKRYICTNEEDLPEWSDYFCLPDEIVAKQELNKVI